MTGRRSHPRPSTMARKTPAPPPLPAAPLLLVTGKGGVGRSTTTTALAQALASSGERVALVHPADAPPTPLPSKIGPQPDIVPIDRDRVFEAALSHQLPRPLAAVLKLNRAFRLLAAATPGLSEMLTLAELRRMLDGPYDRLVFDAPATGHLLALLDAPGRFERAAAVGPIARRARQVGEWIQDPSVCALIGVTTANSLAVSELLDLIDTLEQRNGRRPELVVANRLAPPAPAPAERGELAATDLPEAARGALEQLIDRAVAERAQIARLTSKTGHPPLRAAEWPGRAVEAVADAFLAADTR